MVICAGPTGAGKTTTLYASLMELDAEQQNITTIEDPVEYVFSGINQIKTNEQAGLSFATGLRALLRQDPDVILVGEIRDPDTARLAVQAAHTGHLVLSSIHGTDATAALYRLLEMGIEAFLVASSVIGVVGQRLLRRNCAHCLEPYKATSTEIDFLQFHNIFQPICCQPEMSQSLRTLTLQRGAGCQVCRGTGYHDRIGIYEVMRVTARIRSLLISHAEADELRSVAIEEGMRPLIHGAGDLITRHMTTVDEVIRTLYRS
jgi:type IV pilus assembly protein PilB